MDNLHNSPLSFREPVMLNVELSHVGLPHIDIPASRTIESLQT